MSKISKLFVTFIASLFLVSCSVGSPSGGGDSPVVEPTVTGVTVNPSSKTIDLYTSSSFTLTATVSGTGNFNKQVTWSSDSNIAYVDQNGFVSCSKTGTAHITATSVADTTKSGVCTLTIKDTTPAPTTKANPVNPSFTSSYDGTIQWYPMQMDQGVTQFDVVTFPTGDSSVLAHHTITLNPQNDYKGTYKLSDGESAYIVAKGGTRYLDSDPSEVISYDKNYTKFEIPQLYFRTYREGDDYLYVGYIDPKTNINTGKMGDNIYSYMSKVEIGIGSVNNVVEYNEFVSNYRTRSSIADNTEIYVRRAPLSQSVPVQASDWSEPIIYKNCHHEHSTSSNLKYPTCDYAGHGKFYKCDVCGAESNNNQIFYSFIGAEVSSDNEEFNSYFKQLEHKEVKEFLYDESSHWEITYCPNCGDYEISHEKHSHEMVNGECSICGYNASKGCPNSAPYINEVYTGNSQGQIVTMGFMSSYDKFLSNVSAQNKDICNFIILARGSGASAFNSGTLQYTQVSQWSPSSTTYLYEVKWTNNLPIFNFVDGVEYVVISRSGKIDTYRIEASRLIQNVAMEEKQYNVAVNNEIQINYSLGDHLSIVNNALDWSSSNEAVASVDNNGKVKGLSEGSTTITVTSKARFTQGGVSLSASATVYVKNTYLPNNIDTDEKVEITTKNPYQINVNFKPYGSMASLSYSSSNTNVATVSSSGVVTGLSTGSSVITISTPNGLSKEVTFTVTKYDSYEKTNLSTNYYDYSNNLDSGTYLVNEGKTSLLVLPVRFTDSPLIELDSDGVSELDMYNRETTIEDLNDIYFGNPDETGIMSVKSFYEAESNGQLEIDGIVADWYDAPIASTSVTTDSSAYSLAKDALENYRNSSEHPDMTQFDNNNDGYVDGVVVAYAYPPTMHMGFGWNWSATFDTESLSQNNQMWSMVMELSQNDSLVDAPDVVNPAMPASLQWISLDHLRGDSSSYIDVAGKIAVSDDSSYFHATFFQNPKTAIHETGHMFGLPDYYDSASHNTDSSDYINQNLTGFYTMQEGNQVSHDPFSLIALGWQKPYVISSECTIEINKGEVALLSPDGLASNSPFDEYMLVDLWSYGGTDMIGSSDKDFLSGIKPGVRIWHVDSRLNYLGKIITDNKFNSDTYYNQLMLMRADAKIDEDAYEAKHAEIDDTLYEYYVDREKVCTVGHNVYQQAMTDNNLFRAGESFSAAKYPKAFFTDGTFDNGQEFNWIITVVSVNKDRAIVNFKRV